MIKAYGDQDAPAFNEAVDEHLAAVAELSDSRLPQRAWCRWNDGCSRIGQPAWQWCLYLITLVMGLVYFAVNLPRLRQAVWGALAIAVIVHTLAIVCRITITGRAPVINIYSSAVFIGWAAVLFGLVVGTHLQLRHRQHSCRPHAAC